MPEWARAFRAGTLVARADLRAVYTWKTWVFGWLLRIACQVVFYAVIGRLLGSDDQVARLFAGASVMAAVTEVMLVIASTAWERAEGTLPMLATAPGGLTAAIAGRSLFWVPSGLATSVICLFAIGPAFGVRFGPADGLAAVALLLAGVLGTYALGLTLAGLVLWVPDLRNLVSTVAIGLMTACCGAVVPISYWPAWVRGAVDALPITHALAGIGAARQGTLTAAGFAGRLLLAAGTGVGWLLLATVAIRFFTDVTRRTGRYELAG